MECSISLRAPKMSLVPSPSHRARAIVKTCLVSLSLSLCMAALMAGCGSLRTPTVPMKLQFERSSCPDKVETLMVLLPGVYSEPQDFVREGFVRELRQRNIAADILLADAHMGYYRNRSVVDRLQADVFNAARAAGYRSVWLAGISLGGFGTVLYEEQHPRQAAGLVLIAPYLGDEGTTAAVEAAGGLQRWQAPQGEDVELRLWRWLQGYTAQPQSHPPLYLGFGLTDRFARSHQLLATELPPQQVFTTLGGHHWPQWRDLWRQILDVLPLPRCRLPA